MAIFKRQDDSLGASLGVSKKKRDYDLPLNKGSGGQFLSTLIALMTFLAILALSASFTLSEMTSRWVSGLENKASVEIPAEDTIPETIAEVSVDTTISAASLENSASSASAVSVYAMASIVALYYFVSF